MSIEVKISKRRISYKIAMKFLHKRVEKLKINKGKELLWILEHPVTYTAGIRSNNNEIIDKKIKIIKTNRGGKITLHNPGQKIIEVVNNQGGNAVKTAAHHQTGTDRVFEVFKEILKSKPNIIVNLQGDMPNISPEAIKDLVSYLEKKKCDIATLASDLHRDEIENENVVKVSVKEKLSLKSYSLALDFFRVNANLKHNL